MLESNPILEAFGNAKTLRNENSSRFGKFILLQFGDDGVLCGAVIRTYLLEKVRLIKQSEGERSFHVFYQLVNGLPAEERAALGLTTVSDYQYLSRSGCFQRRDGDDGAMLADTRHAMKVTQLLCCALRHAALHWFCRQRRRRRRLQAIILSGRCLSLTSVRM